MGKGGRGGRRKAVNDAVAAAEKIYEFEIQQDEELLAEVTRGPAGPVAESLEDMADKALKGARKSFSEKHVRDCSA